ncbi:MAG: DeoR/GlpR family DNA-binding transcription regulator [Verrucomicrobiota bacterium JB022]|nr:DeoR/GlpR family DNA-binding transcription regulator [Verrucomicrobiota bacterium JB022]
MLTAERKRLILNQLKAEGQVRADALAKRFKVSEDTIRRDLRQLDQDGLLERVHGGALLRPAVSVHYASRQHQSPDLKRAIGAAAVQLLKAGQTVLIDAGTTPLCVAEAIPPSLPLSVVTHSLPVGLALSEHASVETLMVGGTLSKPARAAMGAQVVEDYRQVRADICILGVAGLHVEAGATAIDPEEAFVKRAMIQHAAAVVAVAAPEKLGTIAPHLLCSAQALTHLVTGPAPCERLQPFRDVGIEVIVAEG